MNRFLILTATIYFSSLLNSYADNRFEFEFAEVAPGIWTGIRPDSPLFPVMGNTTFVITDAGVIVYDGGGVATMSDQIIAKVRSLTELPVTHVVISHWHGDHNFGVYRFAEEFPNVQYVTHSFTQAAMNSQKISYISGYPTFVQDRLPSFQKMVDTGIHPSGKTLSEQEIASYQALIDDADEINQAYNRVRVTQADITFDHSLTIHSGSRAIQLLFLGHGNTEGDIVMWLPEEKIVAAGDLVVLPSPYAFNVPPRAWAATLKRLNALGYQTLIPGHGDMQTDTSYVDLLIEASESVADQRDLMIGEQLPPEEVEAQLDFSSFEKRFTGGSEYIKIYYDAWFEGPFRKAALKELTGEPMVELIPLDASE